MPFRQILTPPLGFKLLIPEHIDPFNVGIPEQSLSRLSGLTPHLKFYFLAIN
jgi:hypothetical protein